MKLYIDQLPGKGIGGSAFALYDQFGLVFPCIQAASVHHAANEAAVLDLSIVVDGENVVFGPPPQRTDFLPEWLDNKIYDEGGKTAELTYSPAETMMLLLSCRKGNLVRLLTSGDEARSVQLWWDGDPHQTARWKDLYIQTGLQGAFFEYRINSRNITFDAKGNLETDILGPVLQKWYLGMITTSDRYILIEREHD